MSAISKGAQLRPWGILIFLLDNEGFFRCQQFQKERSCAPGDFDIFAG